MRKYGLPENVPPENVLPVNVPPENGLPVNDTDSFLFQSVSCVPLVVKENRFFSVVPVKCILRGVPALLFLSCLQNATPQQRNHYMWRLNSSWTVFYVVH